MVRYVQKMRPSAAKNHRKDIPPSWPRVSVDSGAQLAALAQPFFEFPFDSESRGAAAAPYSSRPGAHQLCPPEPVPEECFQIDISRRLLGVLGQDNLLDAPKIACVTCDRLQ